MPAEEDVLVVRLSAARACKEALAAAKQLCKTRRADKEGDSVALPVLPGASCSPPAAVAEALAAGTASWSTRALAPSPAALVRSPHLVLRDAVAPLLAAALLPPSLLEALPRRWERLGDVLLLPEDACTEPEWLQLQPALWAAVAGALCCTRLARQAAVDPCPTRNSRAVLLHPPGCCDGWTTVRENGVLYTLDVTATMFSSGNGTEKARMGALPCRGETVVDLFAGIGFYTLPLLLLAGAAHVHACELHPPTLAALRRGLLLNHVPPSACTVLPGDCAQTAPAGVAHRVLLGLLPCSRCGWRAAVRSLRDAGGVLHVHATCTSGRQALWAEEAAAELEALGRERCPAWRAQVLHVELVKSYAPRVLHIVVDIALRPPAGPPAAPQPAQLLHLPATTTAAELQAAAVVPRHPALMRGVCASAAAPWWQPSVLAAHAEGDVPLSVHVSPVAALDWHQRNFAYDTMTLRKLAARLGDPDEAAFLYLRSVGLKPAKEPASLSASFPRLAAAIGPLPPAALPACGAPHSTVLRLASPGLTLWLHYDALDNVLLQLAASKTAILFPPHTAGGLYLDGASSRIPTALLWAAEDGDTDAAAELRRRFPRYAAARADACVAALQPGDALFIPALWAHAVRCGDDGMGAAVNVFWPAQNEPGAPRDIYGNVDCAAGTAVLAAAAAAAAALRKLPPDAAAFYAARAVAAMEYAVQ